MSSFVMTYTDAAASNNGSDFFETDVISICMSSSRLRFLRSPGDSVSCDDDWPSAPIFEQMERRSDRKMQAQQRRVLDWWRSLVITLLFFIQSQFIKKFTISSYLFSYG